MATPTYSNFTVSQTATPDVNLQPPSGPMPGQVGAAQADAIGRAASGTGDAASRIALSIQDQVNQTRVNDAVNQARIAAQQLTYDPQNGYQALKGNDALSRPSGQPLADEYGDKLSGALMDISGSLGNEAQRRAFNATASDLQAQFKGQVEAHALQQFGVYHDSVNDASVALAANSAVQNWDNPDMIFGHVDPTTGQRTGGAIDAIKAATMAKAQQHGLEGAPADEAILSATSATHRAVITAALDNGNAPYAMNYLEAARKSGEMTGSDILALQGRVNQGVWLNVSAAAVSSAATDAARIIAPTPMDRMKQITFGAESGGRDTNPDGTPVTSPVGAKYGMQVMPATAANPGHGIAPAANDSPAEYNRVGLQLLNALVKKYGEPAQAWAAYNAGEGNVDKAIAAATSVGEPGLWLQALGDFQSEENHAQTVAYVNANMAKFNNPTSTQNQRPTELDFINHALSNLPPGAPPQLVQMTREHAAQQYDVINKSFAEQGQNALGAVQQWLYANQGHGATAADVPGSLMEPLLRFAPGDAKNLEAFSRALQRGDVVTNLGRYNDIVTNMDDYAKLSNPQWDMLQTQLAPGTFMQLSKARADYQNNTTDDTSGGLNRVQINRVLNNRLESLQLPTKASQGSADAAWLGATRIFIDQSIFKTQRDLGHKLTPAEIESHIDNLFSQNADFRMHVMGIPIPGTHVSQNIMSVKRWQIPDDDVASIKQAFAKNGVQNPSDVQILNTWRTKQMNDRSRPAADVSMVGVASPAPAPPIADWGEGAGYNMKGATNVVGNTLVPLLGFGGSSGAEVHTSNDYYNDD